MKSENWIIVELGVALLLLGVISFFMVPAYEKGSWFVMGAFASGFSMVMGYKFGRSMPQQIGDVKPGQATESQTTTTTTSTEQPPPTEQPKA